MSIDVQIDVQSNSRSQYDEAAKHWQKCRDSVSPYIQSYAQDGLS